MGELAESLARWCEEGRDGRLEEHETAVLERVRQALPMLLEAVVDVATSELAPRVRGARAGCPSCGRRVKLHQERPRQVLTQCGAVTLTRPWYSCARCHHGWSVVETTLGVGSRQRTSAGLLAWLVRLGATTDYREAADLLDELTGLTVGPETIRRECVRVGTAIRAAETLAIQRTQRTREAAAPLEPAPGLLVLEADGAMIQYTDGWHEVTSGMAAGWDGGRLVAPSSVAAREPGSTPARGNSSPAAPSPSSPPSIISPRLPRRPPRPGASNAPTVPAASTAWTTRPSDSTASPSALAPSSPPPITSCNDG